MRLRPRLAAAAILLALAAAASGQKLGRETPFAPAVVGAAQAQELVVACVPSGAGWLTFLQRDKSVRAMRIDADGHPRYETKQVAADAAAYSFSAATTERGPIALWRSGEALLIAPLGADGVPPRPARVISPDVYGGWLTCGPSRCLVTFWPDQEPFSAEIVDALGNKVASRSDLPRGTIAAAADPDGFLLVVTDDSLKTSALRLSLRGEVLSETAISREPYLRAAVDFDGEQYTIVTTSARDGVRAMALSTAGEVVASGTVYTPAGPAGYRALGIAWSGTQHLVTIIDDESGLPVPTDSTPPGKLFAIRMARDLVVSDRTPIKIDAESYAAFNPFTAANGGSFFTAWMAGTFGGGVGRGSRVGPNGVRLTRDILTLRPLDQQPAALAATASGPVAVWFERDYLTGRTAIRLGRAGGNAARDVADVPNVWWASAAAIEDDVLVAWDQGAAIVAGPETTPVSTSGLQFEPHVAAARSQWMIAGYCPEGICALIVGRDGRPVTREPIVVDRTREARRWDVATDGETFLVLTVNYADPVVKATIIDGTGRILSTARIAPTSGSPVIAWNGREYAVALQGDLRGITLVRIGRDGMPIGAPAVYPMNEPGTYITSLAPFGNGWLMTLRRQSDPQLIHFSGDFAALSVRSENGVAAVATQPDGRAYELSSIPYELAPYPTSTRVVAREILPGGGRPRP